MNIVDIVILVFIVLSAFVGFSRGFFKQTIMFVGTILVICLSFIFKNPLSLFMYKNLPFFKFGGLTSLNILLYEMLAFIILIVVLSIVLVILVKITGIVEKILKVTIILAIPSKLLGMLVGIIESIVILYFALFILSLPIIKVPYLNESKYAKIIMDKTPILSSACDNIMKTFDEISEFTEENLKLNFDVNKANKDILEIILKNRVATSDNVRYLVEKDKIKIDNVNELLEMYKEG